jgi:hypothetical protein
MAIYALKELKRFLRHKSQPQANLSLSPAVVDEILKDKENLRVIERKFKTRINLISLPSSHIEDIKIS